MSQHAEDALEMEDLFESPVARESERARAAPKAMPAEPARWACGDLYDHADEGAIETWIITALADPPAKCTKAGGVNTLETSIDTLSVVRRVRGEGGPRDHDLAWVPLLRSQPLVFPGLSDKKRLIGLRGDKKLAPREGEEAYKHWRPACEQDNWDGQRPILPWCLYDFVKGLGARARPAKRRAANFLHGVWTLGVKAYVAEHGIDVPAALAAEEKKWSAHAEALGVTDPAQYLLALSRSAEGAQRREVDAMIGTAIVALHAR